MTTKRSMKKDERAVSPVIGVIMMIAIVVIIAAVVAAFAYGIIGGVKKAPSTALVVEGVKASDSTVEVNIFHHGGDTITGAFESAQVTGNLDAVWDNLEVRYNGDPVTNGTGTYGNVNWIHLNGNNATDANGFTESNFAPGDQLTLEFAMLEEDDTIIILHVPSENVMQRITIT